MSATLTAQEVRAAIQAELDQMKKAMSMKEAVARTGISEDVLRKAEKAGHLKFRYPSTRVVILSKDLDDYLGQSYDPRTGQ